jgi:hypothetical protein
MFTEGWSSLQKSLEPVLGNPLVLGGLMLVLLVACVVVAFWLNRAMDDFRTGRFPPWAYRLTGNKRRLSRALERVRRTQKAERADVG